MHDEVVVNTYDDGAEIWQMEAREIKRDAEELQDQAEFDIGDNVYVMRKVGSCILSLLVGDTKC